MSRLRCFCFTINNPEEPLLLQEWMNYLVYQKERGENGTEHYQGYCEVAGNAKTLQWLKNHWNATAHIEARRGSQDQAIAYCKKDDTRIEGPFEYGEKKEQGKRNDLLELGELAKSGVRKREAFETLPATYMRHHRAYAHVQTLYKPKAVERTVILLIGPPGVGKTRHVHDNEDEFWQTPLQKEMWFDGYDGQEVALIDDFQGQMPLTLLLQLLDRYVVQVPTKGGFTWWTPKKIYVTSNYEISEWYDYTNRGNARAALERRFSEIRYIN